MSFLFVSYPGTAAELPALLDAWAVAELIHVDVAWVASRRGILPSFDVPCDDGVESLARMRVRLEDLGEWQRAARPYRETR